MTLDEVRRFALALAGTLEAPHHDRTSFRGPRGIYATAPPDGLTLNVFVAEEDVAAAVQEHPECFAELWWGRKLVGVRVLLAAAPRDLVLELVEEAWRRRT